MWSYLTIYYLLEDVFMSVILWRGHSKVSFPKPQLSMHSMFKWVEINFPLHSLVLFICTVSIVENPDLLPSFFLLTIGWYVMYESESFYSPQLTLMLFQHATISGSCLPPQKGAHPIQIHGRTAKLFHTSHPP